MVLGDGLALGIDRLYNLDLWPSDLAFQAPVNRADVQAIRLYMDHWHIGAGRNLAPLDARPIDLRAEFPMCFLQEYVPSGPLPISKMPIGLGSSSRA